MNPSQQLAKRNPTSHPFRRAVLRGLAILLPPLLTIVIFVWVGNTVAVYLLEPLEDGARWGISQSIRDIRTFPESEVSSDAQRTTYNDRSYIRVGDDRFIPYKVYDTVRGELGASQIPPTAVDIYDRYVEIRYLRWYVVVPVFLLVFILTLYLLGKFLAAGVGKFFWTSFERVINRLPLIRNVYSSVKQVTDFMFTDPDIEYTRVVAVEYPRKGIWSLALVTGESMLDIRSAANEPLLSVLIPTSPMPFTGFTVTVKKSETVDLNITIDQAFQFIVSCGVVVPAHQLAAALDQVEMESAAAVAGDSRTVTLPGSGK
ncbi:MAG: DUF502 domain-containing protein [Pirellulales bacterium]